MEEPTITLPLSEFLKILWGYKKHAELRNRAVPGDPTVNAIKAIPNYQEYVYIQEPKEGEADCAITVWQRSEWKESGERFFAKKEEHDKQNFNADMVADAISKKLPMLDKAFIRQLAYNVCNTKDFSSLKAFGIEEKDLKI